MSSSLLRSRTKLAVAFGAAAFLYFRSRNARKREPERPGGACKAGELAGSDGHYVKLSKGRTFYRMYNEHCSPDKCPIVLVHGFVGSSEYFKPLVQCLLRTERRIIAIDLYGRGHSDFVDEKHDENLFAHQVLELLIVLNITVPIDLVGYSMGGGVVVRLASLYRNVLRSLTLIAPVGLPSMTKGAPRALVVALSILKELSHALYGGYMHEYLISFYIWRMKQKIDGGWTDKSSERFKWFKAHYSKRLETSERNTLPKAAASTLMNFKMDGLGEQYSAIGANERKLPTLTIWGEDDSIVPCDVDGIKRAIPHAVVKVHKNRNHNFPIQWAEECALDIRNFFDNDLLPYLV
eukprot:g3880.t1